MDIFCHFNFCHNGRNCFCFDNRIFERIGKKSTWENSIAFCFHQYAILVHNTKREKISLFLFLFLFNLFYEYAKLQNYKFLNYLQYFCETFFQMHIMYLCTGTPLLTLWTRMGFLCWFFMGSEILLTHMIFSYHWTS